MAIKWDYELAHASAWDEGNRSMTEGGRTAWNEDDYNAAVSAFNSLHPVEKRRAEAKRFAEEVERGEWGRCVYCLDPVRVDSIDDHGCFQ